MQKNIHTEIEINASAERVWEILSDFESFASWNPFVTEVKGEAKEGAILNINVQPPGAKMMTFTPTVLKAEPNEELRWVGTMPLNLFRGEHFYVIQKISDDKVLFIHGEIFSGWLVRLIWSMQGKKIAAGYILMNEALKKRAEEAE